MATWAATTFCTAADVRTRAEQIDGGVNQGQKAVGKAMIDRTITLAKDLMRQDVIVRAQRSYPTTVQAWLDRAHAAADRRDESVMRERERLGFRDRDDEFATDIYGGGTFSSEGRVLRPQTFTNAGAPTNGTSGTEAGYADNGARLIDTDNDALYINRGTLASPTWERFTAESMIDYIANPTELKHAAVMLTLALLYENRIHRFSATHEADFARLGSIVKYCRDEYTALFDKAIAILQIDASNDGTVDDVERSATRNTGQLLA
jgi:hypothetical protein